MGYIDTETLTGNIANQGLLTLLLLVSVSIALERTAILRQLSARIITPNFPKTLFNLTLVGSVASAFLNNTAVVSTLTSVVKKTGIHPSRKLLIPLSYAAILGGTITLVGTSTNLIINSFYEKETSLGLSMFHFALLAYLQHWLVYLPCLLPINCCLTSEQSVRRLINI